MLFLMCGFLGLGERILSVEVKWSVFFGISMKEQFGRWSSNK
jgi:hypothetical protein